MLQGRFPRKRVGWKRTWNVQWTVHPKGQPEMPHKGIDYEERHVRKITKETQTNNKCGARHFLLRMIYLTICHVCSILICYHPHWSSTSYYQFLDHALFGHVSFVPECLPDISCLRLFKLLWGTGSGNEQLIQSWIPRADLEALPTPSRVLSMKGNSDLPFSEHCLVYLGNGAFKDEWYRQSTAAERLGPQ